MKVGSLVFATDQGLGYLAKAFYDHGIINDVMMVKHKSRQCHREWYPPSTIQVAGSALKMPFVAEWCLRHDVMLFFETPFEWSLINVCREHGVKTVLMPMYECMPKELPAVPDLWLCPSQLDLQWAQERIGAAHTLGPGQPIYLPVPVEVPWKLRSEAKVFVHNAGHGGLRGRNGTAELLEAIPLVKSPAMFVLRSQDELLGKDLAPHFPINQYLSSGTLLRNNSKGQRIQSTTGTARPDELYDQGDVFIFPEKFNGLSLPLQEALASGMFVIATDRFPINTWLFGDTAQPPGKLIKPIGYQRACVAGRCVDFDEAIIDPKDIAAAIDEVYGQDITRYSKVAREWADSMSWERLKPRYLEALESL